MLSLIKGERPRFEITVTDGMAMTQGSRKRLGVQRDKLREVGD